MKGLYNITRSFIACLSLILFTLSAFAPKPDIEEPQFVLEGEVVDKETGKVD